MPDGVRISDGGGFNVQLNPNSMIVLLLARVAHAIGLGGSAGYSAGRFAGTILTFGVLLAMAVIGVWRFVAQAML